MALRKITREDVDRLRMPDETPQRTVAEMNVNPFDLGPARFGDARGMVDPKMLEALAWNQPYDVDAREAAVQAARDRIAAALVAQQGMPPPLAAAAANQMVSDSSVFGGDSAQGVNPGSGADGVTGLNSTNQGSQSFSDMLGLNPTGFNEGAPPANSNPDDQSLNEGDRESDTQTASFDIGGLVSMAAGMPGAMTTSNASMYSSDPDSALGKANDAIADFFGGGGRNAPTGGPVDPTGGYSAYGNPTPSGFTNSNSFGLPTGGFTPGGSFTAQTATPAPTFSAAMPDFPTSFDDPNDSVVSVNTTPVAAPPADAPLNPNTPHITVNPNSPREAPDGRAPVASTPAAPALTPGGAQTPGGPGGTGGYGGGFSEGAVGGYTGGPGATTGYGGGYSGSSDMGNTQGAQGFTSGFSAGFEAGMAAMAGGFDTGSGAGDGAGAGAGAGAGDSGGSSAGGSDGASGGVG